MTLRRGLWLGATIGWTAACSGSEFTSLTTEMGGRAGTSDAGGGPWTRVITATSTGSGGSANSEADSGIVSGGSTSTGAAGATGTGGTGGGSGGPAGSGGADGSAGTSGSGGIGGSRDAGIADVDPCLALRADLDQKLAAAQKCDPQTLKQCVETVPGVCCKVPVASKDSPETKAYVAAFESYNKAHCATSCPAVPCPAGPGSCNKNDTAGSYLCWYGLPPFP